jgi:hypothetical protein
MTDKYILDGHTAVPEPDLMKWARWFESVDSRRVKRETVGESDVSTVFLGMDHSFGGPTPILFETMVFDGPLGGEMNRCSTWEQAEKMHDEMVRRVKEQSQ